MESPRLQQQGFDALYGLALIDCSEERAEGTVEVRDELTQGDGLLHGGVLAALAEALAASGTAAAVGVEGKLALGLSVQITVLHPVRAGAVSATAVRRHRGRTTWVWEVEMTDAEGLRCAVARVTVAVRDREG
jgi:1,4-dihydroxy-2-naphthoyl-CoA hydrolase